MLLTTREVASLLQVHPKHVYRLLKRGLPAHRVGDEWRFDADEVRRYCRVRGEAASVSREQPAAAPTPPLLAANGDLAMLLLLDEARKRGGPLLGHVQADHATGLALLRQSAVMLTGCHGASIPPEMAGRGLARVHVAEREIGLAHRRGLRLRSASGIVGRRLAYRPSTAGVRAHLDRALGSAGVELERAYAQATHYDSHRDVVMALVREDDEVGLVSRAWATRAGLGFLPLASEAYGLVLRASDLGDPRVVALCEIAQSGAYRTKLRRDFGYEARRAGEIRIGAPAPAT
jgi:putative molybdopterin biosynthesis protein